MKKELFILFTNNEFPGTKPFLKKLNLSRFGNAECKISLITSGKACFLSPEAVDEEFDVLLIYDEVEEDENHQVTKVPDETISNLTGLVSNKDKIYVILHQGPDGEFEERRKGAQKSALNNLCKNKIVGFIESHSTSGVGFNLLMNISKHINDKTKFKELLEDLKLHFLGQPEVEAKLSLLHKCLTSEGAKEIIGDFSKETEPIKNLFVKPLKDLNNQISATYSEEIAGLTCKEVIKELSQTEDCFSDEYLRHLSALRDALALEESMLVK